MTEVASRCGRKVRGRKPAPLAERFWSKVEKRESDECWPWMGGGYGDGYGGFMIAGLGCIGAHRVAYALTNGTTPDGVFVLHRCDNRRCCNPAHLFLGDHSANMEDMANKGRSTARLTPEEAIAIRALAGLFGWTETRLARRFKVEQKIISQLLARKTYRHVGKDLTLADFRD